MSQDQNGLFWSLNLITVFLLFFRKQSLGQLWFIAFFRCWNEFKIMVTYRRYDIGELMRTKKLKCR